MEIFAHFPDLITLKLKGNCLYNLSVFSKKNNEENEEIRWKSLKYLDLSENKVSEINSLNCPLLKHLNLQANEIKKLESFEGLENLETLNLAHN